VPITEHSHPPAALHTRTHNKKTTCAESHDLHQSLHAHSVKLHLRDGWTDGRTDAGNSIKFWCILALRCDIWWQKF